MKTLVMVIFLLCALLAAAASADAQMRADRLHGVPAPTATELAAPLGAKASVWTYQSERQCGQRLGGADRYLLWLLCAERDVNQSLASVRTATNLSMYALMASFGGLAWVVNAGDHREYHTYQFLGQTAAGYLFYVTNTSRGGFLRWAGFVMVTNAAFQAVVNKAAGLCDDWCWTNAEEPSWDLRGFAVPKLCHGSCRSVQFSVGIAFVAAGLIVDFVDYAWPNSGRNVEPIAGGFRIRF